MIIEGLVTVFGITFIKKVKPDLLPPFTEKSEHAAALSRRN
jgi:hypothetical protein